MAVVHEYKGMKQELKSSGHKLFPQQQDAMMTQCVIQPSASDTILSAVSGNEPGMT